MTIRKISTARLFEKFVNSQPRVMLPEVKITDGTLTSYAEYVILAMLCQIQAPNHIFEIGTFNGLSAKVLNANAPTAALTTLDLPYDSPSTKFEIGDHNRRYIQARQRPTFDRPNIHPRFGDSATFDFELYFKRMDFVFIDGAHTGKYTENDSRKAAQMLSKHGMIVWHDYDSPHWPQTTEAINQLAQRNTLFHVEGTYLVFYKENFSKLKHGTLGLYHTL